MLTEWPCRLRAMAADSPPSPEPIMAMLYVSCSTRPGMAEWVSLKLRSISVKHVHVVVETCRRFLLMLLIHRCSSQQRYMADIHNDFEICVALSNDTLVVRDPVEHSRSRPFWGPECCPIASYLEMRRLISRIRGHIAAQPIKLLRCAPGFCDGISVDLTCPALIGHSTMSTLAMVEHDLDFGLASATPLRPFEHDEAPASPHKARLLPCRQWSIIRCCSMPGSYLCAKLASI
jgi:hypothetical protein